MVYISLPRAKLLCALTTVVWGVIGCGGGGGGSSGVVSTPLQAKFNTYTGDPQNQIANTQVNFDASDSVGKEPLAYSWDFGDGTTAQAKGITHQYAQGGTYQVTLKVTDADGLTATKTIPWKVSGLSVRYVAGATGGAGRTDGASTQARFNAPSGIAVSKDGNTYVVEPANATIRKITPDGTVSTFAGKQGMFGFNDGDGVNARFKSPESIAIDGNGYLYVGDFNRIRKVSPGGQVSTLAGAFSDSISVDMAVRDGPAAAATFNWPKGITVDSSGNVFVIERNAIRKIANGAVTTFAGKEREAGLANGAPGIARLNLPDAITIDSDNNLFVLEACSGIRKITPDGTVSSFYSGNLAQLLTPATVGSSCGISFGIAINAAKQLFVTHYNEILTFDSQGQPIKFAGTVDGEANGNRSNAKFKNLQAIAVAPSGDVLATGRSNTVRKIGVDGNVTTLAGLADDISGTNLDGVKFMGVSRIAKYRDGFTVATDGSCVQLLRPGNFASVLAGNCNVAGNSNANGANARFGNLSGIAVDSQFNVYVADTDASVIRKISTLGDVTTYVGTPYSYGSQDGPRATATLGYPSFLAVDDADNLWIADRQGLSVRMVTPSGEVKTLATAFDCSANGTTQACPIASDIAAGPGGSAYIAFTYGVGTAKIFKITSTGQVSTFIDSKNRNFHPDDYSSVNGMRLAVDAQGDLWELDSEYNNNTSYLRHFSASGIATTAAVLKSFTTKVYANDPAIEFIRRVEALAFNADGSLMMVGGGSAFVARGF